MDKPTANNQSTALRAPLSDTGLERLVLGTLLCYPNRWEEAGLLRDNYFSLTDNAQICATCQEMLKNGETPSFDAVEAKLRPRNPELADYVYVLTDGITGLAELKNNIAELGKFKAFRETLLNCEHALLYTTCSSTVMELQEKLFIDEAVCAEAFTVLSASAIEPEPVEWLWPGVVPRNKLSIFAGDPGIGKSLTSLDAVALLTTGRNWPGGIKNTNPPMRVLLVIAEDGLADTVVPRLMSLGANLDLVDILSETDSGNTFNFERDMSMLDSYLKQHPDTGLLVCDPVLSRLGDADSNREQELRNKVLSPLKIIAETRKCTILGVAHFKKGQGSSIQKIAGSMAFVGVARSVWGFHKDDDPNLRHMLSIKSNLSADSQGFKFTIGKRQVLIKGKFTTQPFVDWLGASAATSDELLAQAADPETGKMRKAKRWLNDYMAEHNGSVLAKDGYKAANGQGINESTLKKAKLDLGVESEKDGERWYWVLATDDSTPPDVELLNSSSVRTTYIQDNTIVNEELQEGIMKSYNSSPVTLDGTLDNGLENDGVTENLVARVQELQPSEPKISPFTGKPYPPSYAKYKPREG